MAQLEFQRDFVQPATLRSLRTRISRLQAYSAQGPDQAREAGSLIFSLQNSVKARDGRLQGLLDKNLMVKKQREEDEFRSRVMANAAWKADYGQAWAEIADAQKKAATHHKEQVYRTLYSQFATLAMNIVQYVAEVKKADGERLAGYHDAQLESLRFRMFSPAPVYPGVEIVRLTGALDEALAELGPNDIWVKAVLRGRTPQQAAKELVSGTKLADPALRRQLVEGGQAAMEASTDPMIALARQLDPMQRATLKWFEDNVQSVEQRAGEQIGKARFAVFGKTTYPDATFTLRLSYGQVQGYPMNGTKAPAKTTFFGLFDRAAGFNYEGPFYLPARYKEGRDKLNLATPLDFVTTNDIIGGNSGSPVINRQGEIVGLIFDGNIESLAGEYVYDGATNRAVAVHTGAMTEALRKLYNAPSLVKELVQ
ncbi:conserved hypothetical protein [Candidatus Sulfopaludibacter sp. SbA3]|nr:conserved hypothetical protein [Candidatus Sulfopaludibacter sp. SbA3]